jgi:hypothetical protein
MDGATADFMAGLRGVVAAHPAARWAGAPEMLAPR